MELVVEPEAEEDLENFPEEHQSYIIERLSELEKAPTAHHDTNTIEVRGRTVFKYSMKEGSRGGKDYRAIFDIQDNVIRVAAIFHRDKGYRKEEIARRF